MADAEEPAVDEDAIPETAWTVARRNDEIEPLLGSIHDHQDELPDDWP